MKKRVYLILEEGMDRVCVQSVYPASYVPKHKNLVMHVDVEILGWSFVDGKLVEDKEAEFVVLGDGGLIDSV